MKEFKKIYILPLPDRVISMNFADNKRSCRQIFVGWDVSLATNHSILVIRITILIRNF